MNYPADLWRGSSLTRGVMVKRSRGGLEPTTETTDLDLSFKALLPGKSEAICPFEPADRSKISIDPGNIFS